MKSINILHILLAIFSLVSVSCVREYSYEGGRSAVYRLSGAPDACTNVLTNGAFHKGVPADTNSIDVEVEVSVTGNYSLSTNTVHGISFSASGAFSDTGLQTVRLAGKGTPDTTGDFEFRIVDSAGCSFTITVLDVNINTTSGFSFVGSPDECLETQVVGTYMVGTKMDYSNQVTVQVNVVTLPVKISVTTPVVNGVSFAGGADITAIGKIGLVLLADGKPEEPGIFHYIIQQDTTLCGFDIAFAGAQPYAEYVLQSFPGNDNEVLCSSATVQGTYTAGTPLNAGNTLTINPYVTTPGNYTISTTALNGMKFSATGTFTNAGDQFVVLKGSGTPEAAGTFTFIPQIVGPAPLGGASCGVEVEVK